MRCELPDARAHDGDVFLKAGYGGDAVPRIEPCQRPAGRLRWNEAQRKHPRAREHPLHFRLPVHESKDRVGTDSAPAQIDFRAQRIDRDHLDPVLTG